MANLTITSWNGDATINQSGATNFTSNMIPGQRINLHSQAVYVDRPQNFPLLSGAVLLAHSFTFQVVLNAGGNISTQRDLLKSKFNVTDFQPHKLIATDESSVQWYLSGIPVDVVQDPGVSKADTAFLITLAVSEPVWKAVSLTTDTWTNPASGGTHAVAVGGTVLTLPKFAITPTGARTGTYSFYRWVPIYNPSTVPLQNYPIDATNGGLNTQVIITATHMQSAGQDFRLQVDGSQVNRWLDGINTTTTKLWANFNLPPSPPATLLGALPNNGTAVTVPFKVTAKNLTALKVLKAAKNPIFLIGTEAFSYTQANVDLVKYQITNCQRAQKFTSFAAHSDGDSIIWIPFDVWMIYGNSTVAAQDVDDTQKPLLDMHNSTNTSWVFANFFDTASARPGAWSGTVQTSSGKLSATPSHVYTGDQSGAAPPTDVFTNPSVELGLKLMDYQKSNAWKAETATLFWLFTHPTGIITVSMAGKKYAFAATAWPSLGKAGLQKSNDQRNWLDVWMEAAPPANAWTAFTHNTVSLSGTYKSIRLILAGTIPALASSESDIQGDTVTLALDSTLTPVVSVGAEQNLYYLACTITNTDTGDYFTLNFTMSLNRTLTVDCDKQTVTYDDGTNAYAALTLSSNRANWMTAVGPNLNLKFDDPGTGTIGIVTTFANRILG